MLVHPLYDTQVALEEEMIGLGRERFFSAIEKAKARGDESSAAYSHALMKRLFDPTLEALNAFMAEATSGRPGPKHRAVSYLLDLEPETITYLTLKSVLDSITGQKYLQAAALNLANLIQDEMTMRAYKKVDKGAHKRTYRMILAATTRRHKRLTVRHMAKKSGVDMKWGASDKVLLGTKLIELVAENTGLVEIKMRVVNSMDTPLVVRPTTETLEWIEKSKDALSALCPAYMPTVIPPRPWSAPLSGGYWTRMPRPLPLVKTRNRAYLEELEAASPTEVYAAVNAMQETPWAVNVPVMDALRRAWDESLPIKGVPASEATPLPPKPADIDDNEVAKAEWKKSAARVYAGESKRQSRYLQLARTLDIAKKFSEFPAFYFPHTLDFRGRAYAVPMFLNPQGPDTTKALLRFAEGKPLGDGVAAGWLAVHGSNSYGFDKAALEDRVAWVEDHTDLILAVAADPFSDPAYEFWTGADAPWQFLAFCYEWAGFQREGFGFVSSLPVALDGSCNGLQHYSAALRDPVGGAAVNLVPAPKPSDIYAQVATVALGYVAAFARPDASAIGPDGVASLFERQAETWKSLGIDPRDMARRWEAFGIDRKITKRAVMTLPYGSSQYSCREFIEDAMREKLAEGKENPFRMSKDYDGVFHASLWLQPLVWRSIGEVVKAAREGMAWLKECASLAAKESLPIYWKTADGLPVMQAYYSYDQRRVKTHVAGQMIRLSFRERTDKIDRKLQAQGIAPNWVHSQDATALRMYVNLAKENGLTSFALVHDSYGTVAADVEMMGACLRRAFVRLYTDNDPLAEFRVDMQMLLAGGQNENALPPLPPKGSLDLSLVEQSDFFFA